MSTPARMSLEELFRACEKGDVESVRRAVESGVNVKDAVDKEWFNCTSLHHACRYYELLFRHTASTYLVAKYRDIQGLLYSHRFHQCRVHLCSLVGVIVMVVIVMRDLWQQLPCGQKVPKDNCTGYLQKGVVAYNIICSVFPLILIIGSKREWVW